MKTKTTGELNYLGNIYLVRAAWLIAGGMADGVNLDNIARTIAGDVLDWTDVQEKILNVITEISAHVYDVTPPGGDRTRIGKIGRHVIDDCEIYWINTNAYIEWYRGDSPEANAVREQIENRRSDD